MSSEFQLSWGTPTPTVTWSLSGHLATVLYLMITWLPFAIFIAGFPRKTMEKPAGKATSLSYLQAISRPLYAHAMSASCMPSHSFHNLHHIPPHLTRAAPLLTLSNPRHSSCASSLIHTVPLVCCLTLSWPTLHRHTPCCTFHAPLKLLYTLPTSHHTANASAHSHPHPTAATYPSSSLGLAISCWLPNSLLVESQQEVASPTNSEMCLTISTRIAGIAITKVMQSCFTTTSLSSENCSPNKSSRHKLRIAYNMHVRLQ